MTKASPTRIAKQARRLCLLCSQWIEEDDPHSQPCTALGAMLDEAIARIEAGAQGIIVIT